ncbi:CRISPR-associated helicase Cas3' [Streptomonospora salina]|uniref:CRISPR-associated helicase Cas3/CRISPR-associated endonuclease Cas3-HD n=1 Tax=Streptomonospora salina TaxID=104205 RepID=A0A841E6K8_9ACTN|nr:CRISPR-associated helicase Cas3' [Streptomonospora salina]MBB5998795.1 CRISPR-associated helicase Cas3/CRISPR-associated endonuclease Cas3-HD [Streptomonospora salina]
MRLTSPMDSEGSPLPWPDRLSAAARAVWAKHDHDFDGWLPLWRHMADSAAVAGRLWDEWVPDQVRRLVSAELPGGADDARRLAVWLAAVHDIGKATPAFACQVEGLADRMRSEGLEMRLQKQIPDRNLAPHGLAGQLLLQEWLIERHGWPKPATLQLSVVVGGHHGIPPTQAQIHELIRHRSLLRTRGSEDAWRSVQHELLDAAAQTCAVHDRLPLWREVKLPQPVQALLTAVVIMADWIASNPELFPYFPGERGSDPERVDAAWQGLNLPRPWAADEPEAEPGAHVAARFDLPAGARIRPVQEAAVAAARDMAAPGLMVIEAPMGEGKTEAALAVAEVFAARSGAGGCFIALPTMATGNAMFPRLLDWLDHLPDTREGTGAHSVFLAHSKAALNEDFAELMRAGRRSLAGIDRDGGADTWQPRTDAQAASAELVAHHWLRGRKKGMLSSFAVGTIDQLLFAGLKSRHLALRHLALAGKVVVIDEAHAYDTYMNAYLDRVLSWLGAYRVPVVVLSATLPSRRRRELAHAYAGAQATDTGFAGVQAAQAYPLITAVAPGGLPRVSAPEASGRGTAVHVERLDDDFDHLTDRLETELEDGGCVLVVRNTVRRVVETAAHLRTRFGDEQVTVAHARFLDPDRADNDAGLLAEFGSPDYVAKHGGARPERRIVVASQVAEQSLDVDFDLLVSDLAPIDLLLQRMGRLHRHRRGADQSERPPRLRRARCLITGADWDAPVPEPDPGSRRVYRTYPLLRSAAALEPYLARTDGTGNALRLPEDISPLVQRAYGDEEIGPAEWGEAMGKARADHEKHQAEQHAKADAFLLNPQARPGRALVGWVDAGVGDADDTRRGKAQVRDTEETLEVLVVQRRPDGALATVPWLSPDRHGRARGGLELPTDTAPDHRRARIVAACGLRLPPEFSNARTLDRAIAELEEQCVPGWQSKEAYWLAGELVLVLDEECHSSLAGYELRYTRSDGLEVHRAE